MIVVNPSTRQFNIPGADLVFGVESDSGSVRKYFQCPRYVGNNLDLAASFIRMNYRNANGEIDSYLVDDLTVDGENVTFSWKLYPKVTAYKGQLKFVMCVAGPDTKVAWHTTLGTGIVLEGLEPDYAVIQAGTADVVAQLISMVEAQTATVEKVGADQVAVVKDATKAAQDSAVAEIEAKRVNSLNSIPNDYAAMQRAVDGLTRGKAGAIVCEAEGSAITVNDASNLPFQSMRIFGRSTQDGTPTLDAPVEIKSVVEPVMTVAGKNLLKPKYGVGIHAINGLNFTVNADGSVILNGTPATNTGFVFEKFDVHEDVILTGCPSGGTTRTYRMTADCYKNDQFVETMFDLGDGLEIKADEADYVNINIFAFGGTVFDDLVFFPMLRLARVSDPTYEPYKPVRIVKTAHPLRGIPVTSGGNYTDENGQQWICDEVDLERGVYVQRVSRKVFDGTEQFDIVSTEEGGLRVVTVWDGIWRPNNVILCSHLVQRRAIPGITQGTNSRPSYYVPYATVDEWKNFLAEQAANGTPMVAQTALVNPIETPLSETEIAAYRSLHTNKPNTTILNDGGAHMKVEYAADTKLYIDNLIKNH